MKVRAQLSLSAKNAKSLNAKAQSESFAKIQNINRDRDKTLLPGSAEFGSEEYILDFVVSLV